MISAELKTVFAALPLKRQMPRMVACSAQVGYTGADGIAPCRARTLRAAVKASISASAVKRAGATRTQAPRDMPGRSTVKILKRVSSSWAMARFCASSVLPFSRNDDAVGQPRIGWRQNLDALVAAQAFRPAVAQTAQPGFLGSAARRDGLCPRRFLPEKVRWHRAASGGCKSVPRQAARHLHDIFHRQNKPGAKRAA
jgi:hypothetical protein